MKEIHIGTSPLTNDHGVSEESLELIVKLTASALEKAGFEDIDNPADAIEILVQQRDEMLDALESVIEWDKKRRFLLPYRVRDPIHTVLFKVKGGQS